MEYHLLKNRKSYGSLTITPRGPPGQDYSTAPRDETQCKNAKTIKQHLLK